MNNESMEVARQIAAQAWCEPETEMIEMDVRLAEAFAKRINALRTRLAESEAEVGRLRDTLEAVTECEEHRPCGLCRERVRRAVEVKP